MCSAAHCILVPCCWCSWEWGRFCSTGMTKQWLSRWRSVSTSTLLIEVWGMVGIPPVPQAWLVLSLTTFILTLCRHPTRVGLPHKLWSGWKGSVTKNVRCSLELCHSGNFKGNGALWARSCGQRSLVTYSLLYHRLEQMFVLEKSSWKAQLCEY